MELCELKIQTSGSVTETETQAIQALDYAGHGCAGRKQNRVLIQNRCDYGGSDRVAHA
jgi:hypothetical protein